MPSVSDQTPIVVPSDTARAALMVSGAAIYSLYKLHGPLRCLSCQDTFDFQQRDGKDASEED